MNENTTLRINVRCIELPGKKFLNPLAHGQPYQEPVYLGIQRGREVMHQMPADRDEVTFDLEFRIQTKADGMPNFLGPYAQGTPDDRFFYLSWGIRSGADTFKMFRRLKIRLGHLQWPQIRGSMNTGKPINLTLRLTDACGSPLCATPPDTHITWGSA